MRLDNSEWRGHRVDLLRYVGRRVDDVALREDIVQEAFVRLLAYQAKPDIVVGSVPGCSAAFHSISRAIISGAPVGTGMWSCPKTFLALAQPFKSDWSSASSSRSWLALRMPCPVYGERFFSVAAWKGNRRRKWPRLWEFPPAR
jgi:hypothetical protein